MTTRSGMMPQVDDDRPEDPLVEGQELRIAAVLALRHVVDDDGADGDHEPRDPHPGEEVGEQWQA